jgi:hypothetical protein
MDVSAAASIASAVNQAKTGEVVSTFVLKKALDAQSSTASALLEALPPVTSANNLPPHLGQNIDTTA